MKIESILRLALLAVSALVLLLFLVSYWAGMRKVGAAVRGTLIAVAVVVNLVLLDVTAARIAANGPFLFLTAAQLGVAVALAVAAGLAGGAAQQRGKRPTAIVVGGLVLIALDLVALYTQTHRIAEIADELGIGKRNTKYVPAANLDCPENLKKLYIAFQSYVDANGALPPADKWMENDDLVSRVQKDEWLHCPEVSNRHDNKFGYAYNEAVAGRNLSGKALKAMPAAATTPLLYDSTNLAKSAHDAFTSLPKPGRHGGRNNILYCDGHVETVAPK